RRSSRTRPTCATVSTGSAARATSALRRSSCVRDADAGFEERVGSPGGDLEDRPRAPAETHPPRLDVAIDAHGATVGAQPDQVEREAHLERLNAPRARDQKA